MSAVSERGYMSKMVFMIGGLIIWAFHFVAVYVFNALACARRFWNVEIVGIGIVPLTVTVLTVLSLLATLWVMLKAFRWEGPIGGEAPDDANARFMRHLTITVGGMSLLAIFWGGIVTLILAPCA